MSIRRRGRSWQVRLPGETARTFPTRAAADKYELNRRLARSLGDLHQETPVTVTEMLDGHLRRWQARTHPAPATLKAACQSAKFWRDRFGEQLLDRLSLVDVDDQVAERAVDKPAQAKKELELLKRGLRDAQRRGQRFDAALLQVDPVKVVSRTGVALDLDELDRLASWFPEHLALMPGIVASLALRLGEALGLTDDRVDVRAGKVFIPAAMCKERRDKTVELTGSEAAMLAEQLIARPAGTRVVFPRTGSNPTRGGGRHYRPGRWSDSDFYERVWRPARDAAAREWRDDHRLPQWEPTRFDGLVPHDLRHTGISLMAASGMRPETIAARVGHKDGGTLILARYRHLFPDEMTVHLERYEAFMRDRREQRVAETGS